MITNTNYESFQFWTSINGAGVKTPRERHIKTELM